MKEQPMNEDDYLLKARTYLRRLCEVKPNRRTGSPGNRQATDFFVRTMHSYGYAVDATPFECLDYVCAGSSLVHGEEEFQVHTSPHSLGCDVRAEVVAVSTIEELEDVDCEDKLLLMRGALCAEQLMPKGFVFYNPQRHQRIIALLEGQNPAAIITATGRKPQQVGALYPFPLIVDGDFCVPSVYCRGSLGDALAGMQGSTLHLRIDAGRIPSQASNVIAQLHGEADTKIVITAHIDAYQNSPGASDNASGVVVLLLLAEMLANYEGDRCIEIAALNGEDHYSAGGQMDYLARYGGEFDRILLAVNVDDVGFVEGGSAYSFYECPRQLQARVENVFQCLDGLVPGDPWFSGDHMLFVQSGVPSLAFTAECMRQLMRTVTHTAADTPEIVDCHKLVVLARALASLIRSL
jgi:aminopeptidase YwaD